MSAISVFNSLSLSKIFVMTPITSAADRSSFYGYGSNRIMSINKRTILDVFNLGDTIETTRKRKVVLTAVTDTALKFRRESSGTVFSFSMKRLAATLLHLDEIKAAKQLEPAVRTALAKHGMTETISEEGYLYSFALEFDKRTKAPATAEELTRRLQRAIEESKRSNPEDRRKRLMSSPTHPEKITVTTTGYRRNPDVIAEALYRASGMCQHCNEPAPFVRAKNNEPYLEVHHILPLAAGGKDTLDNVVAVCPNCHRKAHYG